MPAKNLLRVTDKNVYLHIYNKGVEGKIIFADKEDSSTFLSYLRDYLIDPKLIEKQRKSFTVKGKTYHGTPHQPKNYYKKVELIAYSINPDHFHLVVHQRSHGVIQGFIRSLCTRYSIYFNKKYSRRGSLFEGPYKSAQIPNTNLLLHLITYLHRNHGNQAFSSLNAYLNNEECAWVSKFDFINNAEKEILLPQNSYSSYAENYIYTEQEKELLASVIIEKDVPILERRILDKGLASKKQERISVETRKKPDQKKAQRRIPEYIGLTLAFLLLLTLGLRSINIATLEAESLKQVADNSTSQFTSEPPTQKTENVLSASASDKTLDPLSLMYSYTVIKKDSGTIVVYKDKDINSGAITTAHAGDHFVAYPIDSDWYQVRFTDDSKGYILSKHIDIEHIDTK